MIERFSEESVAKDLGLSRDELKKMRAENLFVGEDFVLDGRSIMLTKGGIDRLRGVIGRMAAKVVQTAEKLAGGLGVGADDEFRTPSQILPGLLKKIADAAEDNLEELTVSRTWPNPRVLDAVASDGRTVRVRVRSSKNFIAGMILRARPDEFKTLYSHEGRTPRFRGRW